MRESLTLDQPDYKLQAQCWQGLPFYAYDSPWLMAVCCNTVIYVGIELVVYRFVWYFTISRSTLG
jgi:hypothetical protein